MDCWRCGASLDRPGDYCLQCDTGTCDGVVVVFHSDRATLTMLNEETVLGETVITTVPDDGERTGRTQLRNFAGRVADEIRRKRPETVYATGQREPLREARAQLRYEFYRVPESGGHATNGADASVEGAVAAALERRGKRPLETVESAPDEKIGGSHSTLIGGRTGRRAVRTVAEYPHVKKIIPGPIDAGGTGSQRGPSAKVTRADANGNVRMLLRDGSSVQENRVVTTAGDRETGERVRAELNDALADADLR